MIVIDSTMTETGILSLDAQEIVVLATAVWTWHLYLGYDMAE